MFYRALFLLFAASGCAALIYEIVWLQLLQFVIGSSAISLGVLLGTFMGGMCLGSLALPRAVSNRRHPMRVYAAIELGIGICGAAVLFGMPWIVGIYSAWAGQGFAEIALRAVVCAVCLLPPTLLMGASLPAIARWIESTRQGLSWLGFFYGGNIAGAVTGCLLAGFYLLRVHDLAIATYAAVSINAAAALVAWLLSKAAPYRPFDAVPAARASGSRLVYLAIALSGLTALGAETVWTRLLSLTLGATVYTFSIILAVFLTGLGLGSSAGSFLTRRTEKTRLALACCQLLLAIAIAWAGCVLARWLPYWKMDAAIVSHPWKRFAVDSFRCVLGILPAAILWGASFPLALSAAARGKQDSGRLVGRVYAANTLGAIVGAIALGVLCVPAFGSQNSERLLVAVSLLAAILLVPRKAAWAAVPAGALLIWTLPAVPWGTVAYGPYLAARTRESQLLFLGEGMNSSIAVTRHEGTRYFHVSGKIEASSEAQDMRLQRMLGHIPALIHPKPESVLVVGCGAGVTAGSFVAYPEVQRIVICEIEHMVPQVVARYFSRENYDVVNDRRTQIVNDDARHYVFTAREQFDIITSDPIHPWVKGSATLYTKEYFELCKQRLKPGGIITQWVPLYESTPDVVKSEIATFLKVFPDGVVWGNDTIFNEGYDVVLMGRNGGGGPIDLDAMQARLERPGYKRVLNSLRNVGFTNALELMSSYAGYGPELRPWLKDAHVNLDRNLRLQYLAGMRFQNQQAPEIYMDILSYRKLPPAIFK